MPKNIYRSGVSSSAINVYQYLQGRAGRKGECFPGHRRIAADLNLSVSTVKRRIRELEQAGFVEKRNRRRINGGKTSNLYTLL